MVIFFLYSGFMSKTSALIICRISSALKCAALHLEQRLTISTDVLFICLSFGALLSAITDQSLVILLAMVVVWIQEVLSPLRSASSSFYTTRFTLGPGCSARSSGPETVESTFLIWCIFRRTCFLQVRLPFRVTCL